MANTHRGEVSVRLVTDEHPDGYDFTLRPTFDAMETIQAQTGVPLVDLLGRLSRISLPEIRVTLRELLKAGGHELGDAAIGKLIEDNGLDTLCGEFGALPSAIMAFFRGGRPAKASSGEKNAKRPKTSRSTASQK